MTEHQQVFQEPHAPSLNIRNRSDRLSFLQFICGIVAIAMLWGVSLFLVLITLLQITSPLLVQADPVPLLLLSASFGACGLLVIPSVFFSYRRMQGQPPPVSRKMQLAVNPRLLIFWFPIILFLGYLVTTETELSWLLLPPLHVLAVLIPIIWLVYLAVRGLPRGSSQRAWGVFDSGLVLAPGLVMVLELTLATIIGVLIIAYLSSRPEFIARMTQMMGNLSQSSATPDMIIDWLIPYLASPWVVWIVLMFVAVFVPLIEELVKPIGVWLLAGRRLSPAAGYTAGILSGAGFALFESLAMTSSGEEWVVQVVARIGAAVVHIFTAGLMGWALAVAWRDKRYLRLGLTYLLAVGIHGAWNALAVLLAGVGIYQELGLVIQQPVIMAAGYASPIILGITTAVLFGLLLWFNSRFRAHLVDAS